MTEEINCYSKDALEELYKSLGDISSMAVYFGKSQNTIKYWFKKFGIKFITNKTLFMELKDVDFSDKHKSIVLGSLLGDGYIEMTSHSNKNARLTISHCESQKMYLDWVCNNLKPFSKKVNLLSGNTVRVLKGRNFNCQPTYYFRTVSHPYLAKIRTMFYNYNKIKTIGPFVIDMLDELALLVWYCDDGSLHIDKRDGCMYINMATNGFSYNEQLILIEALSKFFNGSIRVYQHSDIDRNDYYIRMYGTKHIREFLNKISSVGIPNGMYYKFDPQRLDVGPLLTKGEGTVRTSMET